MPLFDFGCKSCGKVKADTALKMHHTSEDFPKCECNDQPMEKLVGIPATAQFRGRGFHRNDYRAPTRG